MNIFISFFKTIGDFFLDKNNNGDEKRFFGIAFLVADLYYFLKPHTMADPLNQGALSIIGGLGLVLLGVASWADKISPPQIPNVYATSGKPVNN